LFSFPYNYSVFSLIILSNSSLSIPDSFLASETNVSQIIPDESSLAEFQYPPIPNHPPRLVLTYTPNSSFSRHFIIQVDEVLGHQQFRKKYPKEFELYRESVKGHYWLYSTHSDKFIITHKGENDELGVYVRTKQGGWFGIGDWWNSARLDVIGELWNNLVADIDNFSYTKEEKKQIIKEGTI
jgi:hypothetical protein